MTLILGTYKKMTSGVRVPYAFLYAAQAVGALLLLWVMIDQTIPLIRGLRKGKGGTDA